MSTPVRVFGDVCRLRKGRKPVLVPAESRGAKPYLVAKYLRGGEPQGYALPDHKQSVCVGPRDIFIICDGSNSGETFTGFDGVLSSTMAVIDHGAELDSRYLIHYLGTLFGKFNSSKTGSAIPHLDLAALRRESLPVPQLPEQKRIVAILDEAFEGIAIAKANAEQNVENARAVFESYLGSMFLAHEPGDSIRHLDEVCVRITVGHVGSMVSEYRETGVPFLRSQNVRPFHISLDNMMFVDETFNAKLSKSQLAPGDVAVVRTGYPGTAAVIPDSLPRSNCSDLVIMRPGQEIEPQYLAMFLNSSVGKELVLGRLVGAAQRHFNVGAAKKVPLQLPSLAVQRSRVAAAERMRDETERMSSLLQRKLDALDALKKSLLNEAFAGNL